MIFPKPITKMAKDLKKGDKVLTYGHWETVQTVTPHPDRERYVAIWFNGNAAITRYRLDNVTVGFPDPEPKTEKVDGS